MHDSIVNIQKISPEGSPQKTKKEPVNCSYSTSLKVMFHDALPALPRSIKRHAQDQTCNAVYGRALNMNVKYNTWKISPNDQFSHAAYWRGIDIHVIPIYLNEKSSIIYLFKCIENINRHSNTDNPTIVIVGVNKEQDCVSEEVNSLLSESIHFVRTSDKEINRENFLIATQNASETLIANKGNIPEEISEDDLLHDFQEEYRRASSSWRRSISFFVRPHHDVYTSFDLKEIVSRMLNGRANKPTVDATVALKWFKEGGKIIHNDAPNIIQNIYSELVNEKEQNSNMCGM